jgi:ABC-type dipeptide/oligopeptide/nickel transport system ATPase subunit
MKIKLLEDTPTTTDELYSRKNIADALLQIITEQKGGKSIGLIGEYGSGKSSIISMLEEYIMYQNESQDTTRPKIICFNFDSWEHEGIALKRTFIEKLFQKLNSLVKEKPSEEVDDRINEIEKKIKQLKGTYCEEETTTTPKLTIWGLLLSISSLVGIPLGISILAASLSKNPSSISQIPKPGIVSLLLPFILLLIYQGFQSIKKFNQLRKKERAEFQDDSPALFHQTATKTQTIRKETLEPTSLEFETIFSKIVELLLEETEEDPSTNKRLLIVIDNIDRVDHETASKIFAALKPFIQTSNNKNSSPLSAELMAKIWYLFPVDLNAFNNIWKHSRPGSEESIAKEFSDKLFQLKIRVPPPIMANWKDYFKNRFNECFCNGFKENDLNTFLDIYDVLASKDTISSPRQIKTIINDVSLSWMLRKNIPLKYHFWYSGLERFLAPELRRNLASDDIISKSKNTHFLVKHHFPEENFLEYMAALNYNLPEKEAIHVLFSERIRGAIKEGKKDKVQDIESIPGIEYIIPGILNEILESESSNTNLARAAYVMQDILTKRHFKRLAKVYVKSHHSTFDEILAKGSTILMENNIADYMLIQKVCTNLRNDKFWFENHYQDKKQLIQFLQTIQPILEFVEANNNEDILKNNFKLPLKDDNQYYILLSNLPRHYKYNKYFLQEDFAIAIAEKMSRRMDGDGFTSGEFRVLKRICEFSLNEKSKLEEVIRKLARNLHQIEQRIQRSGMGKEQKESELSDLYDLAIWLRTSEYTNLFTDFNSAELLKSIQSDSDIRDTKIPVMIVFLITLTLSKPKPQNFEHHMNSFSCRDLFGEVILELLEKNRDLLKLLAKNIEQEVLDDSGNFKANQYLLVKLKVFCEENGQQDSCDFFLDYIEELKNELSKKSQEDARYGEFLTELEESE